MSTVHFKLDVGETVKIGEELWKVHSFAANGDHNMVYPAENRFERKTAAELLKLWSRGDLEKVPIAANENMKRRLAQLDVPFDSWPDEIKKATKQRAWYVKGYMNRHLRRKSKALLAKMIKEVAAENKDDNPPSVRQVQRWVKIWDDQGSPSLEDVRILAPQFKRRGNREKYFHPDVEQIMEEVIEELYLQRTPEPIESLRQEIVRRVKAMDFSGFDQKYMDGALPKTPSWVTIQRTIKMLDFDVRVEAHHGRYARIRKCDPVVPGPRPSHAMAEVEIDHTLTDWILFDYKRMVPLGRPWLILIIDRTTRCILAYLLTFKKPDAAAVLRCMKMMMLPKDYVQEKYPNVRNPWEAWGKPGTVIVDNGAEFHSADFLDNLFVHNIDMQACPVYSPWYKGRIERAIGTMMKGLCHITPGTTFSNIVQRGDYKSEKLAVVDVEHAHALIHEYICDVYHQRVHRSLGMSPAAKWRECIENKKGPKPPGRIKDIHELAFSIKYRPLTREGIKLHGLTYCNKSKELHALFNRADRPEKVKVRYDNEDLSYLLIEDWHSHRFVRVENTDLDYTSGLSEAAHDVYQEYVKQRKGNNEAITVEELMEAKHRIREKLKFLVKHRKKLGKRVEAAFGSDVVPDIVREISEESIALRVAEEEDLSGDIIDIEPTDVPPKRRKQSKAEAEEVKARIAESMVAPEVPVEVVAQRRRSTEIVADFD